MKKLLTLLLAFAMLLGTACAETVVQVNTELEGHETQYRLYDREVYEAPCEHPGQVVKVKYESHMYGEKTYKRYVNVYLPYGYDENGTERYPVIYFFHGNGCDQTTLIGNPYTVNAFDHMIENGEMPASIIVAPTYFYDVRKNLVDEAGFIREMREEIMPLVEGTYRTYAETADEAGFTASRNMRAICGFSRGCYMTWTLMPAMVDYARTFLPFSYFVLDDAVPAINQVMAGPYAGDVFIYTCSGGPEDSAAYTGGIQLAKAMLKDEHISFGSSFAENNYFYLASDNPHQDLCSRYYLYNAFLDGLFK